MAQSSNKPPGIRIAGFRSSIPSGYILGRTSAGIGDVELISLGKAQSVGLIPSTLPPSGAAGADLGGTYPNPTVVGLQGIALPAPTVAHQALLYAGSGYVWTLLHLEAGATGQVLTKVDGTDYNFTWVTPHYLIAGGTTGQVLTKNTNTDYDVTWTTPSAGGSGTFASSFFLDGTHGYVAEVDSNGLVLNDSMGRGIYSVDPVLPVAMLPVGSSSALGAVQVDNFSIKAAAGVIGTLFEGFLAQLSTSQAVTNSTYTKVIFDTLSTNTLGSQYSVSTGLFTPTKAGKYLVFCNMLGQVSGGTPSQMNAAISKNGTFTAGPGVLQGLFAAGALPGTAFTAGAVALAIVTMNGTTDTIEIDIDLLQGTGISPVAYGSNTCSFGAIYLGT